MKSFMKVFAGIFILSVMLAGCGGSAKSKLIGGWKVVVDDHIKSFMEISEERIIVRKETNEHPVTVEYILTETQDGQFILEMINPESGSNEFLFAGYFDNKDTIIVKETSDGAVENYCLIRVDNIEKEKEKEEKRLQAEKEKELAKKKEENRLQEQKEKERAKKKEENRLQEQKEKERAKEREEKRLQEQKEMERVQEKAEEGSNQRAASGNSLKKKYLLKADHLENKIIEEAKRLYAHDMRAGFYGQYYNEWDDLLQEVWGVLKDTMPGTAFAELKSEQIKWIEQKERHFAEMPADTASSRAAGMDYLANETADRTRYLIEHYMD